MSSVLSPKLSRVYRHLFKNSLFPDERKIGNIAPVPKGALSADSNNYRPITILPVMSKVAEKLIFKLLYKYLEANAYLPSSQYAYRKKLEHVMHYSIFHLWYKRTLIRDLKLI